MGMSSRTTFLALLALIGIPLSTVQGSSKLGYLMQDGDKIKQDKVLDLLDQYVLHVDGGRTDDRTETIDLLDQYVMHVDRGANVDPEADRGLKRDVIRQEGESKSTLLHSSKNVREQDHKKNLKRERGVYLVRKNINGVEKNDKRELKKPMNHLHFKNGVSVKRNTIDGRRPIEGMISLERRTLEHVKEGTADVISLESKSGRRSKRNVSDNGKEIQKGVTVTDSKPMSDYEVENIIDHSGGEDDQDMTSGPWTHSVKLSDLVTLSWKFVDGEDEVEFLVEAATRGYVGVGFSPGGGMAKADIVLSWVNDDNGEVYVVDSHAQDTNGAPVADPEQDCTLVGGRQNESHTAVRFRRALDTCDVNHDYVLGGDTVRLIWAIHDTDPMFDGGELVGMTWHGQERRGVRSLHLLTPPVKNGVSRGLHARHWDVTLQNFTIPNNTDTLYWCKIFKVPPLATKHHMIGYEPLLQPGNEIYVHHMLLHECVAPHFASTDSVFQRYVQHPGEPCYSSTMPTEWDYCMTATVAWAIGSQGEFLPDHVGLPLADGERAKYFMLEIHYDNRHFRQVKDSSGIRIHYSKDLRQYDGGIMVNGINISPLHIVPPYQPEYRTVGYCSSHCTHRMFPQTGIKLVSVVLHSHLAGKKLRLRHIRDGRELPRIAEDGNYDFNYQQARVLPQEVSVLPGDELVTECVYQTPNRTEPTFGGFSTKQEMCLAFVLYYPRTQLAGCYSMTPVKYFFETFGVRQFYDVDMDTVEQMFLRLPLTDNNQASHRIARSTTTTRSTTSSTAPSFPIGPAGALDEEANNQAISALKQMNEFTVETGDGAGNSGGLFGELVISKPDEFRNRSFTSHLVLLPWSEKLLTQRVEESFYAGKHMVFCKKHDNQLAIPLSTTTFPNFTELSEAENKNTSHCRGKIRHSLRNGRSAASPIIEISNIVFLQFATQAAIFIHRFWQ